MKKLMITINEGGINNTNAGEKAKDDIIEISRQNGFDQLLVNNPKTYVQKLLFLTKSYLGKLKNIYKVNADIIVFQYAGYFPFTTDVSLKEIKKYNPYANLYLLIHDIDSLRYPAPQKWQKREYKIFNSVNGLIVHNDHMKKWLQEHGITVPIITLKIFDYLTPNAINDNKFNKKIVFAGNLEKSTFLTKLKVQTPIELFGPHPASNYPHNIKYLGVKKPAMLSKFLNQSFGLVWDGDSTHNCDGNLGNYERYNDPHKVSLYLSAGLPVIVWRQAAIADFILDHNVGIVIDDLTSLDKVINNISLSDYETMKQNVHTIAEQLRRGEYTRKALNQVEKL